MVLSESIYAPILILWAGLAQSSPPSPNQWGYNSPESYYQQLYQRTTSYTPYQDQPVEEKSSLEKTFEDFLESTRQVQI